MNSSISDRFWAKVNKTETCWLWTGSKTPDGYGGFWVGGRLRRAHRFSYESFVGTLDVNLQIDHLCKVPSCVRPSHLEQVTQRENMRRGNCESTLNAAKTECPKGHQYSDENTRINKRPHSRNRVCRTCDNAANLIRSRKRRARNSILALIDKEPS